MNVEHKVDLGKLVCASLLGPVHATEMLNTSVVRSKEGPPLTIAQAPDMLFLPDYGVQIYKDRFVPLEGTPYRDAWGEVKGWFKGEYDAPIRVPPRVDENVCILTNLWSRYFYHWIEELLKVVILERHGFTGRYVLSSMPSFAAEFLALLGIDPSRIATEFDSPVFFQSSQLTTAINLHTGIGTYRNAFFDLRRGLLRSSAFSRQHRYGDRIWLARGEGAANKRNIVNEEEVHATLARYDFEVVDIGVLPPEEQISIAASAKIMGGAHGAAMVHTMFLARGSTAIECFSPDFVHPCVIHICRNLGHRYVQLVHDNSEGYRHSRNVLVDCTHLELILDSL